MAHAGDAETPPCRGRQSWRTAVLQADSVLVNNLAATAQQLLDLRVQVLHNMMDRLDGRTFGRGDADVLWASEITTDLANFLHDTEKSNFISQHEERWPGIVNLYCECFVRSVDMLGAPPFEAVNGGVARRNLGASLGESVLR